MKKQNFFLFCLVASLLSSFMSSCDRTMDDYYYNLDVARSAERCYDAADYLFTVETDDKIVDFIISDEVLHVVKIDCRERFSKQQYNIKSVGSYSIQEPLFYSNKSGSNHWVKTGIFQVQVEWSIVTKESCFSNEPPQSFEFVYNNTPHYLCYRIVEGKRR